MVEKTIRESFPDDSDSFQHTVTPELFQNQLSLDNSSLLLHVGQDTSVISCSFYKGVEDVTKEKQRLEGKDLCLKRIVYKERSTFFSFPKYTAETMIIFKLLRAVFTRQRDHVSQISEDSLNDRRARLK